MGFEEGRVGSAERGLIPKCFRCRKFWSCDALDLFIRKCRTPEGELDYDRLAEKLMGLECRLFEPHED